MTALLQDTLNENRYTEIQDIQTHIQTDRNSRTQSPLSHVQSKTPESVERWEEEVSL